MMRHTRLPHWRGTTSEAIRAWPGVGARRAGQLLLVCAVMVVASLLIIAASGVLDGPSTPAAEPTSTVGQVLSYALHWRGPQQDPLLTLPSGVAVKSSNYAGVRIADVTYYYNLAPRPSFDPLTRGVVAWNQVRVVAVVGDAPNRVMIYTTDSTPLQQDETTDR